MAYNVAHLLGLVCFTDHQNIAGIYDHHIINANGNDQAIGVAAENEGVMGFVGKVQAAVGGDISIHIWQENLK